MREEYKSPTGVEQLYSGRFGFGPEPTGWPAISIADRIDEYEERLYCSGKGRLVAFTPSRQRARVTKVRCRETLTNFAVG